mmetsp:Transcript_2529/g.10082  ORF Transcript_2529/g.10082 Transcript_2529/m.10082 type:complete len:307 (+) Transcript_2529:2112-3032(+)
MVRLHVLEARLGLRAPVGLSVREVPLVGERHHAQVARARHDRRLGLGVQRGPARIDELLLDDGLGLGDLGARVLAHHEHAVVEAPEVGGFLGLGQLDLVVLRLDAQLGAHVHRRRGGLAVLIEVWNADDGDHLERHHPLVLDAVLLAQCGLVLEVLQRHVVVRRVRRHAGHHARALVHQDGHHRQAVDALVDGERGLERDAEHRRALKAGEALGHAPLGGHQLVRGVARRVLAHDEHLAAGHLVRAVVAVGQDPAVGLAVHGLRAQRGRREEDLALLARARGLERVRELEHLHLDEHVLLRLHALA